MRQRSANSGTFLNEATRVLILIVAVDPGSIRQLHGKGPFGIAHVVASPLGSVTVVKQDWSLDRGNNQNKYLKATLEAIAGDHPASDIDQLLPWAFTPISR